MARKAENINLDFNNFAETLLTLMDIRKIEKNKLVYLLSEEKGVGMQGVLSNIDSYLKNKSQPNMYSLQSLLTVFEYDVVLVPRENRK